MAEQDINMTKYQGITSRQPASVRFSLLDSLRAESLAVARECAALTKPLVVPPSGHVPGGKTYQPKSSLGGRLVSNLVSQLLLILFPPGISHFKIDLESLDVRELSKGYKLEDGKTMHDAMRETFVTLENTAAQLLETSGLREKLRMILSQLVVAGNSCYLERDEDLVLIPIPDWVCTRSCSGDLLEVIYREYLPVSENSGIPVTAKELNDGLVTRYTRCYLKGDRWYIDLYKGSEQLPYAELEVLKKDFKVECATWELAAGEDYGRGAVEESLGDIRTYDSGTDIVNQSATALAKVLFLVRPNGSTKASDVALAENTEIITGDANDVTVIQASKVYDMSSYISFLTQIKQALDMAFMMPDTLRRQGERVTAEEIRRMAAEFEKARGGTYNTLASSLQRPVAKLLLRMMFKAGTFKIKLSDIIPVVNTGLQGLGRNLEHENFIMFLQELSLLPGAINRINVDQGTSRLATLRNLEIAKLLKTPAEVMSETQDNETNELARQVGPDIIKGALTNV